MRVENSFIPVHGVGERTELSLWHDGVTRWDEFEDHQPLSGARCDRVLTYIDEARDALRSGDAGFFDRTLPSGENWRMYRDFADDVCFFDIETTGLDADRHRTTTVSFHIGGETETLVRGDDLTADNVETRFEDAAVVATYNGKRFDVPFLRDDLGVAVDIPHIDTMYLCRRLDLTGGLKSVERDLGIDREGVEDVDGREAVRLWHAYEDGDTDALERLIEYNRHDARNLRVLLDELHDRLHPDALGTP